MRTVGILERRDLGREFGPSPRAGGVEFEILKAVLFGYAGKIQGGVTAGRIQVVGAVRFGQQYVKIGSSRADTFVVVGERVRGWSVSAGVTTLMERTVKRP